MISSSLLNNLRLKFAYAQIDPRLLRPLDRSNHPFFERGLEIDYMEIFDVENNQWKSYLLKLYFLMGILSPKDTYRGV